jgi:hypothetical protein
MASAMATGSVPVTVIGPIAVVISVVAISGVRSGGGGKQGKCQGSDKGEQRRPASARQIEMVVHIGSSG